MCWVTTQLLWHIKMFPAWKWSGTESRGQVAVKNPVGLSPALPRPTCLCRDDMELPQPGGLCYPPSTTHRKWSSSEWAKRSGEDARHGKLRAHRPTPPRTCTCESPEAYSLKAVLKSEPRFVQHPASICTPQGNTDFIECDCWPLVGFCEHPQGCVRTSDSG